MKKQRKIITDRKPISDTEILNYKKPFNELISNGLGINGSGSSFGSLTGWGLAGLGVIATSAIIYFSMPKEDNNNLTSSQLTPTDTAMVEVIDNTQRSINPPFGDMVPYESFRLKNNKKAFDITTKNGSKIHIPAGAFVDAEGNEITKDIEIKYRDFYNPLDIFLAGIPMDYDSAGTNYTFTSAGMFEIDAVSKGRQLYLKPGEKIDISLVSDKETAYNFYQYDTVSNAWQYEYTESSENIQPIATNEIRDTGNTVDLVVNNKPFYSENISDEENQAILINRLVEEEKLFVINPTSYAFNIERDMRLYTEYRDLDSLLVSVADNQDFKPSLFDVRWDTAYLTNNTNTRRLSFNLIKGSTWKRFSVTPIISPEKYQKAMKVYNSNSNRAEKRKQMRSQRSKTEMDLSTNTNVWISMRNITVTSLGYYNCDRPLPTPPSAIAGTTTITDTEGRKLLYKNLYVAQPAGDMLWTYLGYQPWHYSKNYANVAWMTLPDGRIAIITPDRFKTKSDNYCQATAYEPGEGIKLLNKLIN